MKVKGILRTEEVDNRDKNLINSSCASDSQRVAEYMQAQMCDGSNYPQPTDNSVEYKVEEIVEILQGKTVKEVTEILARVYEWVSQNAKVV